MPVVSYPAAIRCQHHALLVGGSHTGGVYYHAACTPSDPQERCTDAAALLRAQERDRLIAVDQAAVDRAYLLETAFTGARRGRIAAVLEAAGVRVDEVLLDLVEDGVLTVQQLLAELATAA